MRESRVGAGDQVLSGGVGGGGEGVATVGSPDHLCLSVRAGPGTNPAAAGQQIPGQPGKCHAHQLAAIFSSHFLIYCQKNTPLCQKSNIFISLSLESLIVCADGRMTCPSFFSPPPSPARRFPPARLYAESDAADQPVRHCCSHQCYQCCHCFHHGSRPAGPPSAHPSR